MCLLPFQYYLFSMCVFLFNLLVVVFIRLLDYYNIICFSILYFVVTAFLIIVRLCWLHLSCFFLLHPSNFKNLNVLNKNLTNIPLMKTLLTTTDIVLIFFICVSYSLYNCICNVSFYCDEFSYVWTICILFVLIS